MPLSQWLVAKPGCAFQSHLRPGALFNGDASRGGTNNAHRSPRHGESAGEQCRNAARGPQLRPRSQLYIHEAWGGDGDLSGAVSRGRRDQHWY
jgi:hypothetical protein